MAFLKLLLSGGLLFIAVMTVTTSHQAQYHTQKHVIPKHYIIKLIPYINEDVLKDPFIKEHFADHENYVYIQREKTHSIFFGRVSIFILITNETKEFYLHMFNLQPWYITLVSYEKSGNNYFNENNLVTNYIYDEITQTALLKFHNILKPQYYCLYINYVGHLTDNSDGFARISYINEEGNRRWLTAAGNYQPTGVRQLFPCWDEPILKTTFDISVRHHRKYTVLSNELNIIQFEQSNNPSDNEDNAYASTNEDYYYYEEGNEIADEEYIIDENNNEILDKNYDKNDEDEEETDQYVDNDKYIDKNKSVSEEDQLVWSHFKRTDAISTYQVAVVMSELVNASYLNYMWCRQNIIQYTKLAQSIAKNVTNYLHSKLVFYNTNWWKLRVNHVAIPGYRHKGMDNWNIILHNEAAILYDKKLDSVAHKIEVARSIGYKIVQLLFGNRNCLSWWSELWINEGIATFFGTYIVDKLYPNFQLMDLFVVQVQHESLRLNDYYDITLNLKGIKTPHDIHSVITYPRYLKAPILFRMLLHLMDSFRIDYENVLFKSLNMQCKELHQVIINTLNNNTEEFWFLNTTNNFWEAIEVAIKQYSVETDRAHVSHRIDVVKRLECWTKQTHVPVLYVMRNYTTGSVVIKLSENNLTKSEDDLTKPEHCWLPVRYFFQTFPHFYANDSTIHWITDKVPQIEFTWFFKNDWIIINANQMGYYRVNYDHTNWHKIAHHLKTQTQINNINVVNRAQLIDDAFYFLTHFQFPFSLFKNLTSYLSQETNYIAWYPMIKAMEYMSIFFPFQKSAHVKEHMLNILNDLLADIGYEEIPMDELKNCLRQEAAKWACTLNSVMCITKATENLNKHLENPETHKLLPWWREWTYCKGLTSANISTWYKVMEMMNARTTQLDNRSLELLACSNDTSIIIEYLNVTMAKRVAIDKDIENIHYIDIYHSIVARHIKNDEVLDFFLTNFYNIKPKKMSIPAAFIGIINHLYTKQQLHMVKKFARNNNFEVLMFRKIQDMLIKRLTDIIYIENQSYHMFNLV